MLRGSAVPACGTAHQLGALKGIGYCGTEPFQGAVSPSTVLRGLGMVIEPAGQSRVRALERRSEQ